jgi:hypothetical protein
MSREDEIEGGRGMSKPLETHWFLLERMQKIVDRIAPDMPIKIEITYRNEEIAWDQGGCFGRVPWACKFTIPLGHPARAALPKLNRGLAYLQSRYDLGVLAREIEPDRFGPTQNVPQ